MTPSLSAWAVQAVGELPTLEAVAITKNMDFDLEARLGKHGLWIVYHWPNGIKTAFSTFFSAVGDLIPSQIKQEKDKITIILSSLEATYHLLMIPPTTNEPFLRWTTTLTCKVPLLVPFAPKDILNFTSYWKPLATGKLHTQQVGNRSGILFYSLTKPATGNVFYFQNLSSLNAYFEDTETTGGDLVGGNWPEIGFSLPPTDTQALTPNKPYVISDAIVSFSTDTLKTDREVCEHYLTQLANIYPAIKREEPVYHNWLDISDKGLTGLANHAGCWTFADGNHYLNAYVSDYDTPPEIMVQLAVLLPLIEYAEWSGEKSNEMIERLKAGLPAFYRKDMGTMVRWLPKLEKQLDHSEEQKKPNVMDSWYLYHPLMNLARLTQKGDKDAKDLLLKSIDYAIKVARAFDYQWPVFYQMETLKIIKAETAEGEGGELDVPGSYADLMIKMWEITKERKYLTEAKRAVKQLEGLGFKTFYQANNTAYGALALLKLFKNTGDKKYLKMSYVSLAGIFNNIQLWEMDYGHGKNFSTFFSVFPLKDAPYTAAYEEQEVYAALSEYMIEAQGLNILPAVRLLIAEFIKYIPSRIQAYYPPLLPKEMLSEEPKTGEIDPNLWVAIEDLQDGKEPSGQVGQEVYGAGVAFGIVPRQYFKLNSDLTIFIGYPVEKYKKKGSAAEFKIGGDARLSCRVVIEISNEHNYNCTATNANGEQLKIVSINRKRQEFRVNGSQNFIFKWSKTK
ncbi:hypothetical protein [Pedobacter xixiisoli]|uniref:Uncharacterized protein n=1 Tax=Pedobacter xixiisoli TaxID=1476464 RepID=A0A285ZWN0_9SPHI|nr:hypothetical protein [Pedobacter xixiisoli]SOD14040.1 hypothetical protein SAMN06297358_1372 [Pedobacter xixiisoli]